MLAIKKTYRQMDENGDGRVSIREVKTASKRLGIEFSTDQLKKRMGELDENGKLVKHFIWMGCASSKRNNYTLFLYTGVYLLLTIMIIYSQASYGKIHS